MAASSDTTAGRGTRAFVCAASAGEVSQSHLSNRKQERRTRRLVSTAGYNTCLRSPETQIAPRPITATRLLMAMSSSPFVWSCGHRSARSHENLWATHYIVGSAMCFKLTSAKSASVFGALLVAETKSSFTTKLQGARGLSRKHISTRSEEHTSE